jgi:hypothetical protein
MTGSGLQLNIYNRLKLVKTTAAAGMLLSFLCSVNLWAGHRWLPVCPLFEEFSINPPFDFILFALEIILLLMLLISSKPRPIIFFILLLNAVYILLDQNRLQPWFYLYNSIFMVLFFYNWRIDNINAYHSFFVILQLCFASVYIFSGLQKINPNFITDTYSWFIQPLSTFASPRQMGFLTKTGGVIPYLEIFIGLGLLIKQLRFLAIPLLIIMHLIILLLMGPLGNNYNMVVWPWNIIMIVLALLLFSGSTLERYFSFSILLKVPVFYLVIALFWVLPALNLRNHWETYLSFSLYSGNTHNAKILLSDEAYEKLPLYVKHFVSEEAGLHVLNPKLWCLNELKVPLYPEKRIFEKVTEHVIHLTNTSSEDVKLVYIEKLKLFEARP